VTTRELNTRYLTRSDGLRYGLIEAIDALLPALGGEPEMYVDGRGDLDVQRVMDPPMPHSHSTQAAADLILELWNGAARGGLYRMIGHSDRDKSMDLARALRALADDLESPA
jgi:hypothetical protein